MSVCVAPREAPLTRCGQVARERERISAFKTQAQVRVYRLAQGLMHEWRMHTHYMHTHHTHTCSARVPHGGRGTNHTTILSRIADGQECLHPPTADVSGGDSARLFPALLPAQLSHGLPPKRCDADSAVGRVQSRALPYPIPQGTQGQDRRQQKGMYTCVYVYVCMYI